VAPPVFKTGLAGNTLAGRFDSFPPPPSLATFDDTSRRSAQAAPGQLYSLARAVLPDALVGRASRWRRARDGFFRQGGSSWPIA
jgi:hypothetical protein